MKEKLTNNLGLKFLAIFLAFLMWLVVVNVSNPVISRTLDVPVEITNEDILTKAGRTYEVTSKNTVTINYDIRIRDAYKVLSNDFRAYADISELYDVTGSIPIKVEVVNKNVRSLIEGTPSAKPGVIQIKTEELQHKRFELDAHVSGTPEDGYIRGEILVSPEYISVSGPTSLVGQINSVGIEVKLDGANEDFNDITSPVYYDANGNILALGDRVTSNRNDISYQVSILKVKNVSIIYDTQGQVAEGYRFIGVESSVRTIPVVGRTFVLATMKAIKIPSSKVNLRGLSADQQVELDLREYLPEGVEISDGVSPYVTATLKVEALQTKVLSIKLNQVSLTGESADINYTFEPESVDLVVRGLKEELGQVDVSQLNLSIDVGNLTSGTYKGILNYHIGENFEVIGYGSFNIKAQYAEESGESPLEMDESETTESPNTEETDETISEPVTETQGGPEATEAAAEVMPMLPEEGVAAETTES